ncbi:MAG: hypothetical protein WC648_01090 [Candidatus Paceibacterota bacterium]
MTNFYLIQMSRGIPIPIDAEELQKVLQGIQTKSPVIVKQGIFNPSFFVSIIEDSDRKQGWNRELGGDKYMLTTKEPLPDLFEEMRSNLVKLVTLPHD